MLNVTVPVLPSLTVKVLDEKTRLSMDAAMHGLVIAMSKLRVVGVGVTTKVLCPCPLAKVMVGVKVTVLAALAWDPSYENISTVL